MIKTEAKMWEELVPQTEENKMQKSKEVKEEEKERQNITLPRHSQLTVPVEMVDDNLLLRRQVRSLSRKALALGQKVYQQLETIEELSKQLQEERDRGQQVRAERQQLEQECAKMRQTGWSIEKEVSRRQELLEETSVLENEISVRDKKIEQLEKEKQILNKKVATYQRKMSDFQRKNQELEQLFRQEENQLSTLDIKYKRSEEELKNAKIKNVKLNQQVAMVQNEIGNLKLQNKQLQRQMQDIKRSFQGSEVSLRLNESYSESQLNEQLSKKTSELQSLGSKYRVLKKNMDVLKTENSYLKERCHNLTHNEKDLEHLVIDRFLEVIRIYRDRLLQGGTKLQPDLDLKRDAFLKRLTKEYKIYVESLSNKE